MYYIEKKLCIETNFNLHFKKQNKFTYIVFIYFNMLQWHVFPSTCDIAWWAKSNVITDQLWFGHLSDL